MTSLQNEQDDVESVYSKVEFNKQLAQSSLLSDQDIQQSASQFDVYKPTHNIPPITSSTEKSSNHWAQLVHHLQIENQHLLTALQRTHDSLVKCRQDKVLLEDLLLNQKKKTLDQELLYNHHNQPSSSSPPLFNQVFFIFTCLFSIN
ncbi:unnamed protein product [Cunninghamella blakesleeana]